MTVKKKTFFSSTSIILFTCFLCFVMNTQWKIIRRKIILLLQNSKRSKPFLPATAMEYNYILIKDDFK